MAEFDVFYVLGETCNSLREILFGYQALVKI